MSDKHGDSRSGHCLTKAHDQCTYAACTCTAPECPHANHVAAQAETGEMCDNGGASKEAAPAGNRGLTPSDVTGKGRPSW